MQSNIEHYAHQNGSGKSKAMLLSKARNHLGNSDSIFHRFNELPKYDRFCDRLTKLMNMDSTSQTTPLPILTKPESPETYNEAIRQAKLTNQPLEHLNNLKTYYDNKHESNRFKRKINRFGNIVHYK